LVQEQPPVSIVRGIVEVGKRSVHSFFEHRMAIYAEQLSYRGLFGLFPFIILVFALLAVLRVDAVFDRLIEAAMGVPQQQIPEPLEPVAEEGGAQASFLRQLIQQAGEVCFPSAWCYLCGRSPQWSSP
jgi:uncharacterized BrkB/YihY/UPF0761 family membrane protein